MDYFCHWPVSKTFVLVCMGAGGFIISSELFLFTRTHLRPPWHDMARLVVIVTWQRNKVTFDWRLSTWRHWRYGIHTTSKEGTIEFGMLVSRLQRRSCLRRITCFRVFLRAAHVANVTVFNHLKMSLRITCGSFPIPLSEFVRIIL